jgi:hypothetical protein
MLAMPVIVNELAAAPPPRAFSKQAGPVGGAPVVDTRLEGVARAAALAATDAL